jgi:hypothetical protein
MLAPFGRRIMVMILSILPGLGAAAVFAFEVLIDLSDGRRSAAADCVLGANWSLALTLEAFVLVMMSP